MTLDIVTTPKVPSSKSQSDRLALSTMRRPTPLVCGSPVKQRSPVQSSGWVPPQHHKTKDARHNKLVPRLLSLLNPPTGTLGTYPKEMNAGTQHIICTAEVAAM